MTDPMYEAHKTLLEEAKKSGKKYILLEGDEYTKSVEINAHEPFHISRNQRGETVVLHRIMAARDITLANGSMVAAGTLGGWIEKESNLSHHANCWVADEAKVFANAKIIDSARASGHAQAFHQAKLAGRSQICDHAKAFGNTNMYDDARLSGYAKLSNSVNLSGNAQVCDTVHLLGNLYATGDTKFQGNMVLSMPFLSIPVYGPYDEEHPSRQDPFIFTHGTIDSVKKAAESIAEKKSRGFDYSVDAAHDMLMQAIKKDAVGMPVPAFGVTPPNGVVMSVNADGENIRNHYGTLGQSAIGVVPTRMA